MDHHGNVTIYNAESGEYDKGIWYSNDYYKTKRRKIFTYSYHDWNYNTYGGWQKDDLTTGKTTKRATQTYPKRSTYLPGKFYPVNMKCDSCGEKKQLYPRFMYWEEQDILYKAVLCDECWSKWEMVATISMDDEAHCGNCGSIVTGKDRTAPFLFFGDDEIVTDDPSAHPEQVVFSSHICHDCVTYTPIVGKKNLREEVKYSVTGDVGPLLTKEGKLVDNFIDVLEKYCVFYMSRYKIETNNVYLSTKDINLFHNTYNGKEEDN